MELRKITAIVRNNVLESVGIRLRAVGIKGISVSSVRGYGEHADYFAKDWLCSEHSRIEIFTSADRVESIIAAITESAHTGYTGDGMIAVLPVERIIRIRTKAEALPTEI